MGWQTLNTPDPYPFFLADTPEILVRPQKEPPPCRS